MALASLLGPEAAERPEMTSVRTQLLKALLRASARVIDGVYDDHDYGVNDGGKHYAHRNAARQQAAR